MKSEAQQTRLDGPSTDGPSTDGLTAKQVDALHNMTAKQVNALHKIASKMERWTAKRALTQTIDDRIASMTQRMVTLTALKQRVNDMREHECALAIDIMSMTRDQVL